MVNSRAGQVLVRDEGLGPGPHEKVPDTSELYSRFSCVGTDFHLAHAQRDAFLPLIHN